MREIIDDLERWQASGEQRFAVATVLKTFGSSPRGVGATLVVSSEGRVSGSISGGCVESALIDEAAAVMQSGRMKLLHFDTSDEEAWEVGLPCGGSIDVMVESVDLDILHFVTERIRRNERVVRITLIQGKPEQVGLSAAYDSAGQAAGSLPDAVDAAARKLAYDQLESGRVSLDAATELFVHVISPAPTLVTIGGVHTAVALAEMARALGYKTAVVDPRLTFATDERFPAVDILSRRWPQQALEEIGLTRDTAVVVLTHDPKIDDPALVAALRSDSFYVGALGSDRTQRARRERLAREGLTEEQLNRIRGPVGLDIGAGTPEEIALAILSEIVAVRHGRTGDISPKGALAGSGADGRAAVSSANQ
ncbi:XdhC family protein [Salinispira pacifica]